MAPPAEVPWPASQFEGTSAGRRGFCVWTRKYPMIQMRTLFAPLCMLSCCLSAPAAVQTKDALEPLRSAAATFCGELRKERISGLPSPAQLERFTPLITPELRSIIELARREQNRQMEQHPDEKPDWIEGDLFSSLFEGVTEWKLGAAAAPKGADATVAVKLTHNEPGQQAAEWTDTLVFRNRAGAWLVDDIRMGGDWEFHSGETLRRRLPGGSKDQADHVSPDGKWQVAFAREGDEVTVISLTPKTGGGEAQTLFGEEGSGGCPFPTWVVWGPDGQKLAIRLGDGPRDARTLVFRLVDGEWQAIELPELFAAERVALERKGFKERDHLVDAERWQDADTLVLHYFGSFTSEEEGDGFDHFVSVRIAVDGRASVVETVAVPGE